MGPLSWFLMTKYVLTKNAYSIGVFLVIADTQINNSKNNLRLFTFYDNILIMEDK